ncbi:MAG: uncharacterized protein A8A55_0229 [Amphiamblys sp. WSBS2006]|nr:MAG: uncharacterized protein A8A55_0229 [Amphiamblys sp. WSBS2006]
MPGKYLNCVYGEEMKHGAKDEAVIKICERMFFLERGEREHIQSLSDVYGRKFLVLNATEKKICEEANEVCSNGGIDFVSIEKIVSFMQVSLAWLTFSEDNVLFFYGEHESKKLFCSAALYFCEMASSAKHAFQIVEEFFCPRDITSVVYCPNPASQRYFGYIDSLCKKADRIVQQGFVIETISVFGKGFYRELQVETGDGRRRKLKLKCVVERRDKERTESVFDVGEAVSGEAAIFLGKEEESCFYRWNTLFSEEGRVVVHPDEINKNKDKISFCIQMKKSELREEKKDLEKALGEGTRLLCAVEKFTSLFPGTETDGFFIREGCCSSKKDSEIFESPRKENEEQTPRKKEVMVLKEIPKDGSGFARNRPATPCKAPPPPPTPKKCIRNKVWFRGSLVVTELQTKSRRCLWAKEENIDFDLRGFEKAFCVSGDGRETEKGEPRTMQDAQRLNGVSILLLRFKGRYKNIRSLVEAIQKGDSALGEEDFVFLQEIFKQIGRMPEKASLCQSEDIDGILNPEVLVDISRKERHLPVFCEFYHLHRTFSSELWEIQAGIEETISGLDSICRSESLAKILRATARLFTLCRYQYGRFKSEKTVYGFRLCDLLLLQSTQGANGQGTLLEFISGYVDVSLEDLQGAMSRLIEKNIGEFEQGVRRVESLLRRVTEWHRDDIAEKSPCFKHATKMFISKGSIALSEIEALCINVRGKWEETKRYFGDTKFENPRELFAIVHCFASDWNSVRMKQAGEK